MNPCDFEQIDDTLHELSAHGSEQFPFQYYCSQYQGESGDHFPAHWHRELELVVVRSGQLHCMVGNDRLALTPGEGLIVFSRVIHGYEASVTTEMPTVLFMPEFIAPQGSLLFSNYVEPLLQGHLSHLQLSRRIPWQAKMLDCMHAMEQVATQSGSGAALQQHIIACELWEQLSLHQDAINTLASKEHAAHTQTRLRKMIAHIEEHYARKLTLDDIARAASVSVSEALRCFREGVASTPIDYVNQFRLNHARFRLLATTSPITEIAIESGFSSTAYFDRLFMRRFGLTPTAYRKAMQSKATV